MPIVGAFMVPHPPIILPEVGAIPQGPMSRWLRKLQS